VAGKTNRNILAAMLIGAGALLVAVSPVSADDDAAAACVDVTFDFDSLGQGALTNNNPTLGPTPIAIGAGTYDIELVSSDPTHGPGLFTDQTHEQWFFVLDSGYASPVTPDIPEIDLSLTVVVTGVTLSASTAITAVWSGQAPSSDSVHAAVTFKCADTVVTVGSTTEAPTTTAAPTTTVAPTTTEAPTATTAPGTTTPAPSTTVLPVTVPPTVATTTTTASTSTSQVVVTIAQAEDNMPEDTNGDENPDLGLDGELAATGVNLNLALSGLSLIAAGFALVISGAMVDDRRRLAHIRA